MYLYVSINDIISRYLSHEGTIISMHGIWENVDCKRIVKTSVNVFVSTDLLLVYSDSKYMKYILYEITEVLVS